MKACPKNEEKTRKVRDYWGELKNAKFEFFNSQKFTIFVCVDAVFVPRSSFPPPGVSPYFLTATRRDARSYDMHPCGQRELRHHSRRYYASDQRKNPIVPDRSSHAGLGHVHAIGRRRSLQRSVAARGRPCCV